MRLNQGRDTLLDGELRIVESRLGKDLSDYALGGERFVQVLGHCSDQQVIRDSFAHTMVTPVPEIGRNLRDTMPKPPPWTEEDLLDLEMLSHRADGKRLDWGALRKRFPNRTRGSITTKLTRMGLTVDLSWTPEEDKILTDGWNEVSSRTLGRLLPGRSAQGRYDRARKLGLCAGPPQGMVSIKALSKDPKWGYDYYTTLRILKAGGATVKSRNYSSARTRSQGVRYVDQDDAVEAAEAWEKQRSQVETVMQAAERIGMMSHTLWRWLTLEGLVPPKDPKEKGVTGGAGRSFTALPEVYDRVNNKYRVRRLRTTPVTPKPKLTPRLGKESPKMAAARLHIRDGTLREWLTRDGLLPPLEAGTRCHFYAPPEVYDRVAEKYRTSRNAPKGTRHPVAEDRPAERSSTRMAGALPATMTPPPA